jgi:pimeloyl-ACP methyl ester carboxylesterase
MHNLTHRLVDANGIRIHCVELGEGPLVLMCHGFPESWYSWRHQMDTITRAGYKAVAMDMRGYGQSSRPIQISKYDQVTIAADIAGVIDAFEEDQAVIIGHDWGAPAVWHTALLHPERVRAVVGLSVPYTGRSPSPPIEMMKALYPETFFYILYFQYPGIAESELEYDTEDFLKKFIFHASADGDFSLFSSKPKTARLLDGLTLPGELPNWLTEKDLQFYVDEFEFTGFGTALNWYRNINRTWERTPHLADALISQPALFIAGEKDGVISDRSSLEIMKSKIPQLHKTILLENCGHWTQQEKPAQVNQAIVDFLNWLDR